MAKNDAIAKVIAADPYLKERRAPTAVDQQLYLKEVSFVCPLCGKILRHRGQRKTNKLYEIAHIFPNSPTEEQYERLKTLPRLGSDSESFENKIALCKDCHNQQDYHTTAEDYLKLLEKKQRFLKLTDLSEATLTMGLELQIADVVKRICALHEDEMATLNYEPVRLTKKFSATEVLLKTVSAHMSPVTILTSATALKNWRELTVFGWMHSAFRLKVALLKWKAFQITRVTYLTNL